MQRWVTSRPLSGRRDPVRGDSQEMVFVEKGKKFFCVKIQFKFAADEHVAGASRIRTTHQSICHPCLKSNPQSFQKGNFGTRYVIGNKLYQEHKAPSLLSGDAVSRSILAPAFYSFHRRKYPLISVLKSPCSWTLPAQDQGQMKTKGVQFHPSTEPHLSLSRPGAMHQFFNLLQYFSRFLYRFQFFEQSKTFVSTSNYRHSN